MNTHEVLDIQTRLIVASGNLKSAHRRAEKLNLAYGAHRYSVRRIKAV